MKSRKKSQTQKSKSLRMIVVAVAIVATFIAIAFFMRSHKRSNNPQPKGQPASTNTEVKEPNNSAPIAEAKSATESYFKAASMCDLETANSYRLIPLATQKTKEQCQAECPSGIKYEFLNAGAYSSRVIDGNTSEQAVITYNFSCNEKSSTTHIIMNRTSETHKWLIVSMG